VNEAAYILEEGIATRASDIDMVYLTGYGFPLHTGGPVLCGYNRLAECGAGDEKYAKGRHGDAWKPAPLLLKLAEREKFN
jgi:3-hydroxyacyl-CoA dehydrogenase